MREDLDGRDDLLGPLRDVHRVELRHGIQDAIKIVNDFELLETRLSGAT